MLTVMEGCNHVYELGLLQMPICLVYTSPAFLLSLALLTWKQFCLSQVVSSPPVKEPWQNTSSKGSAKGGAHPREETPPTVQTYHSPAGALLTAPARETQQMMAGKEIRVQELAACPRHA